MAAVVRVTHPLAPAVQAVPVCHAHLVVQVPVAAEAVVQAIVPAVAQAIVPVVEVEALAAAEAREHADDTISGYLKHKIETIIRHYYETIAIYSSTASFWHQCPEYV